MYISTVKDTEINEDRKAPESPRYDESARNKSPLREAAEIVTSELGNFFSLLPLRKIFAITIYKKIRFLTWESKLGNKILFSDRLTPLKLQSHCKMMLFQIDLLHKFFSCSL